MEFYLWSKAELEDMLHLPKMTGYSLLFFGVSLVSKKRSLTTEVRFVVNNKNKLFRTLSENVHHQVILMRDLKDTKYPYKDNYKDFDRHPRWKNIQWWTTIHWGSF